METVGTFMDWIKTEYAVREDYGDAVLSNDMVVTAHRGDGHCLARLWSGFSGSSDVVCALRDREHAEKLFELLGIERNVVPKQG